MNNSQQLPHISTFAVTVLYEKGRGADFNLDVEDQTIKHKRSSNL
jgi:hypothetical protein